MPRFCEKMAARLLSGKFVDRGGMVTELELSYKYRRSRLFVGLGLKPFLLGAS